MKESHITTTGWKLSRPRLRRWCVLGLAALCALGMQGCKKEMPADLKSWISKAEQGDVNAMAEVGMYYQRGGPGYPQDDVEALKWFRKASDGGDRSAMYFVAEHYELGKGVTKDKDEAIKWYRKAALLGHAEAKKKLIALGAPLETAGAAPTGGAPAVPQTTSMLPGLGSTGSLPATGPSTALPPATNSVASLKALVEAIHRAQRTGDIKTAAALTRPLIWAPDVTRLRKALRDDAKPALVDKLMALATEPLPPEEQIAKLMTPNDPKRTEIQVHASTTEQLIAYEKGTPAFNEFPGGAKRLAEVILRPGMTFYEVEAVEPGQPSGTKWHLFYWDGSQWTMLGPVWRIIGP